MTAVPSEQRKCFSLTTLTSDKTAGEGEPTRTGCSSWDPTAATPTGGQRNAGNPCWPWAAQHQPAINKYRSKTECLCFDFFKNSNSGFKQVYFWMSIQPPIPVQGLSHPGIQFLLTLQTRCYGHSKKWDLVICLLGI